MTTPNILTAVALAGSLAAFGCTTNRTPGYGEPDMSAATAGTMRPTSTPGSANTMGSMPGGIGPQGMLSSAPASGESASLDALATLKADEAYRGKVLGPAAPGNNSVPSVSMQQTTGQFISPSVFANPQVTVNSSISSAPTPAIVSGAGGGGTGAAFFTDSATLGATATGGSTLGTGTIATGAITGNAAINGVQNVGVTGVSNATATPITNGANANVALTPAGAATLSNPALATGNQVIGTGMANAPSPASNAVATPILTTVGPLGQVNASAATATGGSVLGVTNVAPLASTAMPTVTNTTATGTTFGLAGGSMTARATGTTAAVTMPSTMVSASSLGATSAGAIRARAIRTGTTSASGNVRIVNGANGFILVTNQSNRGAGR